MPDQVKNALIGIFMLAAVAMLVFIMMFLRPDVGDQGNTLRVRFANIDKVTVGTRVTFAGKPVGEVISIKEVEGPRSEKYYGNLVYTYELELVLDSSIEVYNSDEIALRTSGLLGERSVAITPHKPGRGQRLKAVTNEDLLYAQEGGSLEETFAEFNDFAKRAEEVFDAIIDQLDEIKKNDLWENIGNTARNLSDITTSLNSPTEWSELLTNMRNFSEKASNLADRVTDSWDDVDETIDNFVVMSEDLVAMAADGKEISTKIVDGEGTVGKLVEDDDLYLRVTGIMSKANTLMDDVNHYGILFHNDPHWQRLRARRRNLMQKLSTPQEFRNFFNDEVNQVSTALSRVNSVVECSLNAYPGGTLFCDHEFRQLFNNLLLRIEALEGDIKMYNEQLIAEYERGCCQ